MPKTNEQLFEEAERQQTEIIQEAIAETEQEIFDSALDRDPDDNDGDTSLEQMDGEDVLDDDNLGEEEEGEGEEGEGEGDEGEETPPETRHAPEDRQPDGRVPPARMREEAERRRAAEAERAAAQAEARELRARLDALERDKRQPPPQRQQQDPPDLFADPEGRLNWERQQVAQAFNERRINSSFDDIREEVGDERFVGAFKALQGSGNPNLVSEILNANNPGKALMRWNERQSLLSDIGNDPNAWLDRKLEERLADPQVRQRVITGMRNDAMRGDGDGGPRTRTRLPPSLNSATGGTSHRGQDRRSRDTAHTTRSVEQEIFDSAWED